MTTAERTHQQLIADLPADAIRQKDAEIKYGIKQRTLSIWVLRGHVRQYAVISHKRRYVSENDIRRWLGLNTASEQN